MKIRLFPAMVALIVLVFLTVHGTLTAQTGLKLIYGSRGVQLLSYNGVVLEDIDQNPMDVFHIWHMKITDLKGTVLTSGQYGWGENNNSRQWDTASQTWNYVYIWGSIQVRYIQNGDSLDMLVTETNSASSGVILDGAVIYPMVLHFPSLPAGFMNSSYAQLGFNTTGPSVTVADFGAGEVVSVVADATKPVYSGFQPAGSANSYFPIISGTSLDGMATFQPHNDRPVMPGQTDTFTVSLRFAPTGTATTSVAADAYRNWARTWPPQLSWSDRRPIGTVYLASSPTGDVHQPGGYPNNPRRYFNSSDASDFDVRTASGLAAFQAKVLRQAVANVANLQALHAQGAITWDLEGQQYPQETSYVCSPDQIATVAPEMDSIISNSNSPYAGMKLDDAYFKIMRDAGLRVGVCIRPQHFTINPDGTAAQYYLPNESVADELIRKMKFAHDRWGATLFYVDSTVESNGAVLDAGLFQKVAAALPDSLISPEEITPKHYAYTAPFRTFIFHDDLGTDPTVYNYYPDAFSLILINDVDAAKLSASQTALTTSVRHGDVLMGHVKYAQANNPTIVQIYADAGRASSPAPTTPVISDPITTPSPVVPDPTPIPPPTTTPPASAPTPAPSPVTTPDVTILTPANGDTVGGTVNVTAEIYASLDAAGSYLMVDGIEIGTRRVASHPFVYPLDTTALANGAHTLQVWAHNIGNNVVLSGPTVITIVNSVGSPTSPPTSSPAPDMPVTNPVITPVITPSPSHFPITLTYPLSGQAISGTVTVSGTISQTLDAAGSYLMVDGTEVGTRRVGSEPYLYTLDTAWLAVGPHILQIWAHDIGNVTLLSNATTISVTR